MPRPSGGRNYAPLVRSWVYQILSEDPDKMRRKIRERMLDDPIGTLKDLSWLLPRELVIEQETTHKVEFDMTSLTPDLIQQALEARRTLEHDRPADTGPDTPVH